MASLAAGIASRTLAAEGDPPEPAEKAEKAEQHTLSILRDRDMDIANMKARAEKAERERDKLKAAMSQLGPEAYRDLDGAKRIEELERERDAALTLLVRWCHIEGGAEQESLFEQTARMLDTEKR